MTVRAITETYVFNVSNRTVNLSTVTNFSPYNVLKIINLTTNAVIYKQGQPGLGYTTYLNGTMTLELTNVGVNNTDQLEIMYDDDYLSSSGGSSSVITSVDGGISTIGAKADAIGTFGASTASLVALLKQIAYYEAPFQGAVQMTSGVAVDAGRQLRINCTASGNVTLTFVDGSIDTLLLGVGPSFVDGAITTVTLPGTGAATATFANWK